MPGSAKREAAMPTVSAGQALQILEGLELIKAPVETAELCRAVGLDADELAEPGFRVPMAAFDALLRAAERVTGDPLACLHAVEASGPRGILHYLSMAQPTLEEAIGAFERLAAATGDGLQVEFVRGPTHAAIRLDFRFHAPDVAAPVREYAVGLVVLTLRQAATPGIRPVEIRFPHARRGPAGEVERVLGAPVRYRQPNCAILLAAGDLSRRLGRASPHVARVLENQALREVSLSVDRDVVARVAEAIRGILLAGGVPDPSRVSRKVGSSVRTLQRHLAEEGSNFRAVREAVLRELAEALLDDASLSVSEVAHRLGFSDVASFGKAFKRWTGRAPRAWRRIHRETAGRKP
jgi:AraC-like DNA-binding protein